MYAAESGNEKSVEMLLPNSDVKATNRYGDTALMIAARSGNERSVELLLPDSDVEATNNDGESALDIMDKIKLLVSFSNKTDFHV
jgi:ankyrin repeat protein